MASEPIEAIREEIESLKTLRDELRVKIHLGGAEAQDLWEGAEKKWSQLEGKMKRVVEVTHDSAEEFSEAAGLLAEAIRKGYKQIRDVL